MMDSNSKGIIFDIKRFAIHDGAGIRTTVFIKGCPLRCPWCHNPEGRSKEIDLMWFASLCVRCGSCVAACQQKVIILQDNQIQINRKLCTLNADCVRVCPANALKLDGWEATVEAIYTEIMKDRVFYRDKGGLTLSGGEPMLQSDFSIAVLEYAKLHGVNTAIETCLYAEPGIVRQFIPLVDQFFVDIKIFDETQHKDIIGVSNKLILENFMVLSDANAKICVRIPLIPGFTDYDENIRNIAKFVKRTNKKTEIELLNYNPLASNKFDILNETYLVGKDTKPLDAAQFKAKQKIVTDIMEA